MTAKDTMGESRTTAVTLISCDFDIEGVDVILGFPALKAMRVVIDFANHEWRYSIERRTIENLSAKAFAKATRKEPYIYVLTMTPAGVANGAQ